MSSGVAEVAKGRLSSMGSYYCFRKFFVFIKPVWGVTTMYKNRFLKLNMGIFEPPDHHNLDATDLTSQAVSRKVVVFKES